MNSLKTNLRITIALLVLLAATVGSSYLDLGAFNAPVSMLISLLKAGLILIFFMDLRRADGLIRLAAAAGIFWLGILFVLALSDYMTRSV